MGFRISWLAVYGMDKDDFYDRLGVVPTGEVGFSLDHPIAGQVLPNGWLIIVFDELAHKFVGDDEVNRPSADCTIIACNLRETTMSSSASFWENGEQQWSVWYFGEDDSDNLETFGGLPAEYEEIVSRCRKSEDEESANETDELLDPFDVPLEMAARITSFRHDQGPEEFDYLTLSLGNWKPKAKPWWRFWE